MAYKLIEADKGNYKKGRNAKVKYIVIHYTANKGDTAENNCKYFKNNVVKASAHYFVDEKEIVQSVREENTAWAVGALKPYEGTAHKFWTKCVNGNSISIEMCNSVTYNKKVAQKAAKLTKELMKKYKVAEGNVIRHYDVTGKKCPAAMIGAGYDNWKEFKSMLGTEEKAKETKKKETTKKETKFLVKVNVKKLNIRSKPSMSGKKVGVVKKGEIYTIVETSGIWYKLKSGAGWISSLFVKKVK